MLKILNSQQLAALGFFNLMEFIQQVDFLAGQSPQNADTAEKRSLALDELVSLIVSEIKEFNNQPSDTDNLREAFLQSCLYYIDDRKNKKPIATPRSLPVPTKVERIQPSVSSEKSIKTPEVTKTLQRRNRTLARPPRPNKTEMAPVENKQATVLVAVTAESKHIEGHGIRTEMD